MDSLIQNRVMLQTLRVEIKSMINLSSLQFKLEDTSKSSKIYKSWKISWETIRFDHGSLNYSRGINRSRANRVQFTFLQRNPM